MRRKLPENVFFSEPFPKIPKLNNEKLGWWTTMCMLNSEDRIVINWFNLVLIENLHTNQSIAGAVILSIFKIVKHF